MILYVDSMTLPIFYVCSVSGKVMHIVVSESRSHMWSSSTLLQYLDFLTVELRLRRKALGLTLRDKAMVMMDKASVHSCAMFERHRKNWEVEQNAVLIHGGTGGDLIDSGETLVSIPAGWSACGQPNDGWHQHFHALRRVFLKASVGMGPSPKLRKALDDLDLGIDSNARFSFSGLGQHCFCVHAVHVRVVGVGTRV